MKAAKGTNVWLVLIASALLAGMPAIASSHVVLPLENRAELTAENGQFSTERPGLSLETAPSYYDPLCEVASGSSVAPGRGLSQLVHLTDDAGRFGIAKTGTINGSHGIFAVPARVANQSTPVKILRTGLWPASKTKNAIPIPDAALKLFKRPIPVGPYSGWKFFGGVRYAPGGSLSTATGVLSRTSSLVGPKVLIYGPDGVFYVGIATTGGLYIYAQTGGGE